MTQIENRADYPSYSKWMDGQAEVSEIGRPSPERTRAANEVGSAIVHQLNGPLTALRLYVGEIRQNIGRFRESAEMQDGMQQMVEGAFQETERICAMMRLIADSFEGPLYPENAVAHGREVIRWWSRVGNSNSGGADGQAACIIESLTPREREVLCLVSEGCTNKEGGLRMQISYRTFESHRAAVMRKFGAKNVADLIRLSRLTPDGFGSGRSGTAVQA
jgi:DNA-binding CsgD family transcriptional regulator